MSTAVLIMACVLMGCAAVDYASRHADCWPELLGASYATAFLSGVA